MEFEFIGHRGSHSHRKIVGMIFYKRVPRDPDLSMYDYSAPKKIYLKFTVKKSGKKGVPPTTNLEFHILDFHEAHDMISKMNKNHRSMSLEKFQKIHPKTIKLIEQQILIQMLSGK